MLKRRTTFIAAALLGFAVLQPRLEDVFVSLTGEGFDVSG